MSKWPMAAPMMGAGWFGPGMHSGTDGRAYVGGQAGLVPECVPGPMIAFFFAMSKNVRIFAADMATTNTNQQNNPNINWSLILKVTIAVLTAIAGAIGVSKSETITDIVDGIAKSK